MKEEKFIEENSAKWQRLEYYNKRLQSQKLKNLPKEDIREFSELYRLTGFHLAYARTHLGPLSKTTRYLNQLTGAAHNFYVHNNSSVMAGVIYYFTNGFPRLVMMYIRYVAAACLVFVGGGIFGYILTRINPVYTPFFLGQFGADIGLPEYGIVEWDYPFASAFIMTNNIRVALMSFVWGFSAGVGTLYILLINGMLIGALANYISYTGGDMFLFWALILPHGFLELAAIFISGGAGLMIGKAVLIPGNITRAHAIIKEAKAASLLLPGIAVMLVIAGFIEGFFTPLAISALFKHLFAYFTLVVIIAYFARGFFSRK